MAFLFKFLRKRKSVKALWFMLDKLRQGTNASAVAFQGVSGPIWMVQLQSVVREIFGAGSPEVLFICSQSFEQGKTPEYEAFIKNCIETIVKIW